MKRFILLILLSILIPTHANSVPAILVVDAETGKILVTQNADTKNYPASLTKIMTLYIAFTAIDQGLLDWDDKLYVSSYASRQPKSKLYLKKGDTITVEEAIKAMIIRSANDAAVVIAEAIGGTEENFAQTMNGFAQVLGLEKTSFSNASGLTDDGYTSSASDLVRLSMAIMQHFPEEYKMFSLKEFKFKGKTMRTTNSILRTYKGAEGLKTGYTNIAGYNLITSASNKDGRIIAITMDKRSTKHRDSSMRKLLNLGFKRLAEQKTEIAKLDELEIEQPELGSESIIEKNIEFSIDLAESNEEERRKLMILKDGGGNWGMQVGAFYQQKQAIAAAKKVANIYFGADFNTQIRADKSKTKKGRTIYTAVVGGLTKHNAYEACVNYKKCFILKPKKSSELAKLNQNKTIQ